MTRTAADRWTPCCEECSAHLDRDLRVTLLAVYGADEARVGPKARRCRVCAQHTTRLVRT